MVVVASCCGVFFSSRTRGLVRVQRKLNAAKYRDILNENLVQTGHNDPKHIAKTMQKWLMDNSVNALEWPSQSFYLNPIKLLWRNLKMAVHQRSPSNLTELERICREESENPQMQMCKACRIIPKILYLLYFN